MRISDWSSDVCSSDLDGLKAALPKGAQVARENVERAVSTGQEVFGRTLKANEAIAQIAKAQVESTTAKVQAKAEEAVKGATKASRKRSEEHTSELQSLMRISYAVFCLKKKKTTKHAKTQTKHIQ